MDGIFVVVPTVTGIVASIRRSPAGRRGFFASGVGPAVATGRFIHWQLTDRASGSFDRLDRADRGARSAVGAFVRVDDVLVGALADGLDGAFHLASSATDAFVGDRMSHDIHLQICPFLRAA